MGDEWLSATAQMQEAISTLMSQEFRATALVEATMKNLGSNFGKK